MNTRLHTAALSLMIVLTASAFVAPTLAAPPAKALLLTPGESYGLPKFGFSSSTIYGYGEQVVHVRYGSRAAQLGLEPGDVILSLNGYSLTYPGSWNDALSNALYDGNFIRLKVRDVRTGHVYFRETFVGYNNGPIVTYNKKVATPGPKPHFNVQPVGPSIKTIKDIKELFN